MKRALRHFLPTIAFVLVPAALIFAYHFSTRGARADLGPSSRFAEATVQLGDGELEPAAAAYGAMIDAGERSAAVYYNLALAKHRAGDFGAAILNYERAALLDPGAADIAANLDRARRDAATHVPEPAAWEAFAMGVSLRWWSIWGAVSLSVLACIAIARACRITGITSRRTFAISAGAAAALALCASAVATTERELEGRAITVREGVTLRVSPFDDAKAVATLPAGKRVRIGGGPSFAGFDLVTLDSGERGWVETSAVELITDP